MNKMQEQVREFHRAMNIPAPTTPSILPTARQIFRYDLIAEELTEFELAMEANNYLEQIDALCDLVYVVIGSAVELGIDLEAFFNEVHDANMRKVGGPMRADGKQLKPEGWEPPNHQKIFLEKYGYKV